MWLVISNSYSYQISHRQLRFKITLFCLRQRLQIPRWHHLLMKSLCTCEVNESLFDNIYCCPKSLNSIFRSLLYPTSLNFQISNKSIEKRRFYSWSMNEGRKIYYINWICCNKIKRQFFLKIFFKQLCLRNAVNRLIALWQAVPILLKSTRKSSWRGKVEDVQKFNFPWSYSICSIWPKLWSQTEMPRPIWPYKRQILQALWFLASLNIGIHKKAF